MRFVSGQNGEAVSTWECPGEPEDLGKESFNLPSVLRTAVQETGFKGRHIGMVLEHGKLTQQLLSTPPAKGRDLELYIARQVDQLKVVDEEVSMSWVETNPIKESKGLVLYLFPKPLREKLIVDCREAGLHLLMLVAPTALLGSDLAELPIADDEIAMIAAQAGQTTAIVIGGRGGAFFLARSLRCIWNDSPRRLNSELNRSTIFLRQQYGRDIDSVWLVGDGAEQHAQQMSLGDDESVEQMRSGTRFSINVSPARFSPYYWAERLLAFSPESDANVIDREQRNAPRRKMFVQISGGVICLLLVLSLAVVALVEFQIRSATKELAALQSKDLSLKGRKEKLEQQLDRLEEEKEIIRLVGEEQLPPVSGWFLSHLAGVLPEELVLTKVEVHRVDQLTEEGADKAPPEGSWEARLEGFGIVTSEAPPDKVKGAYQSLCDELVAGPFNFEITDRTDQFAPRSLESWISTNGTPADNAKQFYIQGVMGGNTIR